VIETDAVTQVFVPATQVVSDCVGSMVLIKEVSLGCKTSYISSSHDVTSRI